MKYIVLVILLLNNNLFSQQNSILWEAKRDSVSIHILGSHHLYPADYLLNKNVINDLILTSEVFFNELGLDKYNTDSIFNSRDDNSIEKFLGKKEFKIYKNYFPGKEYIEKYTPKEIYIQLKKKETSTYCGYNNLQVMDDYFFKKAESGKIPIKGFEKIVDQLSQMNEYYNYPDDYMWSENKKVINNLKYLKNINCLELDNFTQEGTYLYDFNKAILQSDKQVWDDRNIKWLEKLEQEISINNYKNIFVMVGIGHLNYSNGLIMLLKNRGFSIKPLIL